MNTIDLLPEYVNVENDQVDLRYFLIASGNSNMAGREQPDGDSEFQMKVCIDDLEAPVRKQQSIEQLLASIKRNFEDKQERSIRQAYEFMKKYPKDAARKWQDFEDTLGRIKAFKYFWAFAITCKEFGSQLHNKLKEVIRGMNFRSESCVLKNHGSSYKSIYKNLTKKLASFLLTNKEDLETFPEKTLNKVIKSIYSHETGLLIQGKYLPHYISGKSHSVLIYIYFTDKSNYEDMFSECDLKDLITVFIYWSIIRIKCSPEIYTTPGFRGLDWIRENIDDKLDLSFIKISTQEEAIVQKTRAREEKIGLGDKEQFPTLGDIKVTDEGTNIFELMKQGRDHYSNQLSAYNNRKTNPSTVPKKKQPKPVPLQKPVQQQKVVIAQPKYDDSDYDPYEDNNIQPKQRPVQPQAQPKQPEVSTKKALETPVVRDDFPKLAESVTRDTRYEDFYVPNKKPVQRPVPEQKQQKNEDDFPTLDPGTADGAPTIKDLMRDAAREAKKAGQASKKQQNKHPKPTMNERDVAQSKSIINMNNQKPARGAEFSQEDFPSLAQHPGEPSPSAPVHVQPKPVATLVAPSKYSEADDFNDPPPKKENKKDNKHQPKLNENDFPSLKTTNQGPDLRTQMLEQEKKNNPLAFNDDDFPQPDQVLGAGGPSQQAQKKSTKIKPSKITKYSDLKEEGLEEPESSDKFKQKNRGLDEAIAKLDKLQNGEDDFPTLGGLSSNAPTKAQAFDPQGLRQLSIKEALLLENKDIVIVKKQSKKKK